MSVVVAAVVAAGGFARELRAGAPLDVAYDMELSGATIDSVVTIERNVTLTLSNNCTMAPGGQIGLAIPGEYPYYTRLFVNQPTLAGSGEVVFNDGGARNEYFNVVDGASSGLTFGPGITVRTGTGGGTVGNPQVPLTNQGTFSAESSGRVFTVYAASLVNTGTVQAINGARVNILSTLTTLTNSGTIAASSGGTVDLSATSWTNSGSITADNGTIELGGMFTLGSIGSLNVTNGGQANVVGTLNLNGGTLTVSAARPFAIGRSGRIAGAGTITSADGTPFGGRGNGTVSGVTIDAPVAVGPSTSPTFSGVVFNQPVTVSGGGSITLSGSTNNSSVMAAAGSMLTLSGVPVKLGTVSLTGATLALGSGATYPTALVGAVACANSTIQLAGTLDNAGATLALAPSTAVVSLSGRISGGTVSGPAGSAVLFPASGSTSTSGPTLDGVTLAAGALVGSGRTFNVVNGLSLQGAAISLAGGTASPVANFNAMLNFSGTQTLGGSGTITFDGTGPSNLLRVSGTATPTLTVGPGVTIRTGVQSGSVGVTSARNPLVLGGTISAQTAGKTLAVVGSNVTQSGTMSASGGGTLSIDATSFTNTGTISVDPGSTLVISNTAASAPNGAIKLSGTGLFNYSGASPIDAVRDQLRLGVTSNGADGISHPPAGADRTRALGYVEAATLFHLSGTQTGVYGGQGVDATTFVLFPTLAGDANCDGAVTADDYALLDRSMAAGLGDAHWTDGDFNYDGVINSGDYLAIDTTYLSLHPSGAAGLLGMREGEFGAGYVESLARVVPEPGMVSLLALGLGRRCRRT